MTSEKIAFSLPQRLMFITLLAMLAQVVLSVVLLVRLNQVYLVMAGTQSPSVAEALGKPVRVDSVSIAAAPTQGPINAPVTIVTFADFTCSYCAQHQSVLQQIKKTFGDKIRLAYRHFPRQSQALESAKAAICSQKQGNFWDMHDLLYAQQGAAEPKHVVDLAQQIDLDLDAFNACLIDPATKAQIEQDLQDGGKYGMDGTPTYFVNGRVIQGAIAYEEFETIITQERSTARSK